MGLADILTGMMNGPHGQPQPSSGKEGGGGMSPLMMALLGLLAYKAMKGIGGQAAPRQAPSQGYPPQGKPQSIPQGGGYTQADASGGLGGLGDLLGGLFGGAGGRPGALPRGMTPGGRAGGTRAELIPGALGGLHGGAAAGARVSGR